MFLLLQDFIRIAETYPASSPGSAGANGGNQSAVTAVVDEGGSPAMTTAQLSQLSQSQEEAVIQELKSLCRRLPRTHLFSLGNGNVLAAVCEVAHHDDSNVWLSS